MQRKHHPGSPRYGRLKTAVLVLVLFSTVLQACFGGWPAALAEEETGEPFGTDEPDYEDPDDDSWFEYDPYHYDNENIPFLLFNTEGSLPGIDRESEWTLVLKPDWEDQDLPNRVTKVDMRLYCLDLDWVDNWSHVWLKKYEEFPETITCTGLKIGGKYMLTANVCYDDTQIEVTTGFVAPGDGNELIMDVIGQAAAACKTPDEWQTAKNLYDWLLDHMVYDHTLSYYSSDAILRGTGVCDSYARLYFLLCKAAGLDAYVIYGETNRGYHAWDSIRIGGEWYYADPTWDDHPVNDPAMDYASIMDENGVQYGMSDYKHFMLNKQMMTENNHETYEWLDENKFNCEEQPSTSLAANYYVHTGLWRKWGLAEGDTFRTIPDLIREAFENGEAMWSSVSVDDVPLSMLGSDETVFRLSNYEITLLFSLLKGYTLTLSDGSTVTLDTYVYDAPDMSGRVLNVYPEGKPETDEPGYYELPEDLTHIEANAFAGDPHAGEVICPPGLVSIGSRAFADCKRLWSIRIPSGVQFIADDAFEGCGEFCIWTEHRDSLPVRYAEEHGITIFVDDEEADSNG